MSVNEPGGQFDGIVCIVCIVVSLVVLCKWSTKNLEAPTIMRGLGSKGIMMMMTIKIMTMMIMNIMSILMILIALSLLSTIVIFIIVVVIIIITIITIFIVIIIIIIIRRVYSISVLLIYLLLLDLILSLLRPLRDSWPTNSSNHLHQESTLEDDICDEDQINSTMELTKYFFLSGKVCWLKYRYGSQIDSVNKYIPAHYCSNKFGWFYLKAVDNVDWDNNCGFVSENQIMMKSAVSRLGGQVRVVPNLWGIKLCTEVAVSEPELWQPFLFKTHCMQCLELFHTVVPCSVSQSIVLQ